MSDGRTFDAKTWGPSWAGVTKLTLVFSENASYSLWMLTLGKGFAIAFRCKWLTYRTRNS